MGRDSATDFTKLFFDEYADRIQEHCSMEDIPFEETWYIDSKKWENIDRLSPLFDFDEDEVSRSDEKKKLDLIRAIAIEHYESKCVYCGKLERDIAADAKPNSKRRKLELDHFLIPFSKNGQLVLGTNNADSNIPILSNCVVACPSCNSSKKNREVTEFMKNNFDILFEAVKLNAAFSARIKEVYDIDASTKADYFELLFEKLGLDRSEMEGEIEKRYPDCTLDFDYGHAPSFDPSDTPGNFGKFFPHPYQYQIRWHLVEGGMDSYDSDEQLKEDGDSIEGETVFYDPFSAGQEIKRVWEEWLLANPVPGSLVEEYDEPNED